MSGLLDLFVSCMIFIVFEQSESDPILVQDLSSQTSYAVLDVIK